MTTWLAGAGLAVAVFFVYLLTFSSTPVSDTFTWLHTIDTANFEMMVLAGHALPLYVHFVLKRLLTWLGTPALRDHLGDQEGFLNTNSFCVP